MRFCTLCFSSSFLFNVVIIWHFNMVNTLDIYGRVRVFADLMHVHDTVESGHYLCRLIPDWGEDR